MGKNLALGFYDTCRVILREKAENARRLQAK